MSSSSSSTNVTWQTQVYKERVQWSNDACLAVEAYRNSDDVIARRYTISSDELVEGIRNAITPIFLRDFEREPTETECVYGLVASRRA